MDQPHRGLAMQRSPHAMMFGPLGVCRCVGNASPPPPPPPPPPPSYADIPRRSVRTRTNTRPTPIGQLAKRVPRPAAKLRNGTTARRKSKSKATEKKGNSKKHSVRDSSGRFVSANSAGSAKKRKKAAGKSRQRAASKPARKTRSSKKVKKVPAPRPGSTLRDYFTSLPPSATSAASAEKASTASSPEQASDSSSDTESSSSGSTSSEAESSEYSGDDSDSSSSTTTDSESEASSTAASPPSTASPSGGVARASPLLSPLRHRDIALDEYPTGPIATPHVRVRECVDTDGPMVSRLRTALRELSSSCSCVCHGLDHARAHSPHSAQSPSLQTSRSSHQPDGFSRYDQLYPVFPPALPPGASCGYHYYDQPQMGSTVKLEGKVSHREQQPAFVCPYDQPSQERFHLQYPRPRAFDPHSPCCECRRTAPGHTSSANRDMPAAASGMFASPMPPIIPPPQSPGVAAMVNALLFSPGGSTGHVGKVTRGARSRLADALRGKQPARGIKRSGSGNNGGGGGNIGGGGGGGVVKRRKVGNHSPTEAEDDSSDEHYQRLHRKKAREEREFRLSRSANIVWVVCDAPKCQKWRMVRKTSPKAKLMPQSASLQWEHDKFYCGHRLSPSRSECERVDDWIRRCVGQRVAEKLAQMGVHSVEQEWPAETHSRLERMGMYFDSESQMFFYY